MNLPPHDSETKLYQKRKSSEGQFHHHEQTEGSNYTKSLLVGSCGCNSCTNVILNVFLVVLWQFMLMILKFQFPV